MGEAEREAEASRTESGIYRRRGMGHGQVGPTCFWSAARGLLVSGASNVRQCG